MMIVKGHVCMRGHFALPAVSFLLMAVLLAGCDGNQRGMAATDMLPDLAYRYDIIDISDPIQAVSFLNAIGMLLGRASSDGDVPPATASQPSANTGGQAGSASVQSANTPSPATISLRDSRRLRALQHLGSMLSVAGECIGYIGQERGTWAWNAYQDREFSYSFGAVVIVNLERAFDIRNWTACLDPNFLIGGIIAEDPTVGVCLSVWQHFDEDGNEYLLTYVGTTSRMCADFDAGLAEYPPPA